MVVVQFDIIGGAWYYQVDIDDGMSWNQIARYLHRALSFNPDLLILTYKNQQIIEMRAIPDLGDFEHIEVTFRPGSRPLVDAIRVQNDDAINQWLATAPTCFPEILNEYDGMGYTPLIAAVMHYPELVEDLLRAGSDPNFVGSTGNSALHFAVAFGSPASVETLIRYGADPRARGADGQNVIQVAITYDRPEMAQSIRRLIRDG